MNFEVQLIVGWSTHNSVETSRTLTTLSISNKNYTATNNWSDKLTKILAVNETNNWSDKLTKILAVNTYDEWVDNL